MSMSNVIIFGATGSVGAYAALALKARGHNVIAVGKRNSDNGFFEDHGITYHSIDITNDLDFSRLAGEKINAVVHLAGAMPAKMAGYEPEKYIDTICKGTFNVLEFSRKIHADKIIFSQTRADSNHLMGGKNPIPSEIVKSFPKTGDHAIYTICKNFSVDLIEHYHHQYGIQHFVFRLPTIYGYHPDMSFYVNGVKKKIAYWEMILKAMKGETLEIWGDPHKEKEIFYVKDMAQVISLAVESETGGGVYNVGHGYGVTLEEQIKGIANVFSPKDQPVDIVYCPDKPDGRQFVHNVDKLKRELNFEPCYDYIKMLHDIKAEMQKQVFSKIWPVI